MDSARRLFLLFVLLGTGVTFESAFIVEDDFEYCESTIKKWSFSFSTLKVKENKHTLEDLLFFLHIPRTGGRSYFHCFLKKLYSINTTCPGSYDKLRFNSRLLVTHDDYSVTLKLPKQKTSVVTILRNPVDRVFSIYEFSLEVAARFLIHPSLKSAFLMAEYLRNRSKGVSTLDIWPWKYLVPWMREDMFGRRDARKQKNQSFVSSDSYNMEFFAMPLHEYIHDPIAMDIIHNGATFQVAGLTNNSYLAESHVVRYCVQKHRTLGDYVLEVAKRRLDEMLYVGLTEEHGKSTTMFANLVGEQVISQMATSSSHGENLTTNHPEMNSSFADSELEGDHYINITILQNTSQAAQNTKAANGSIIVSELMETYGRCTTHLRKATSHRRTESLKLISANFSKESRGEVSKAVVNEIISLNWLDVELYKHARSIFDKQHKELKMQKPPLPLEREERWLNASYPQCWRTVFLSGFIIILLLVFLLVNARRTLKLKV